MSITHFNSFLYAFHAGFGVCAFIVNWAVGFKFLAICLLILAFGCGLVSIVHLFLLESSSFSDNLGKRMIVRKNESGGKE